MNILDSLKELHSEILSLKLSISSENTKTISKLSLRNKAEEVSTSWFSGLENQLKIENIVEESLIQSYSENFNQLLKISAPNNLRSRYTEILKNICRRFRDDLIIPHQKKPTVPTNVSQLTIMLAGFKNPDEDIYLKEAIDCASNGYFRAASVLGWCAAIDRIHKTIEKIGFAKFNVISASLASQNQGRFKRFSSPQNIASLSELREVFDTIVLWIIEGMQLIDSNQHTRLKGCFDLRCQSAHPGDAPITEYNLLSFFSDINEIIFKNPKFPLN